MLTVRQSSILHKVVDAYIETGQPVGSQAITRDYHARYSASYSPATVRNEMMVLEDQGYLMQPHTSSGRVPTDCGYRDYVDHAFSPQTNRLQNCLSSDFLGEADVCWEDLADKAVTKVSEMAGMMGVILSADQPEQDIRKTRRRRLFTCGVPHMLNFPEFHEVAEARKIFYFCENKQAFSDWLIQQMEGQKQNIFIGRENNIAALEQCSVMASSIETDKRLFGFLILLGPRRMNYRRLWALTAESSKAIQVSIYRMSREAV